MVLTNKRLHVSIPATPGTPMGHATPATRTQAEGNDSAHDGIDVPVPNNWDVPTNRVPGNADMQNVSIYIQYVCTFVCLARPAVWKIKSEYFVFCRITMHTKQQSGQSFNMIHLHQVLQLQTEVDRRIMKRRSKMFSILFQSNGCTDSWRTKYLWQELIRSGCLQWIIYPN